jgi:hypothetical protein
MRSLPRVVWLYVVLQIAQPALFELVGALSGPINKRGTAFVVLLLVGLAYRSRLAWTLLLLMNTWLTLAVVGVLGSGGILWANVAAEIGTGISLVAVLASRQMREHVWTRPYSATAAS